jgi:hypothetical protein
VFIFATTWAGVESLGVYGVNLTFSPYAPFEMPMHDVHGKVLAKHNSHHRLTRPLRNWSKPK